MFLLRLVPVVFGVGVAVSSAIALLIRPLGAMDRVNAAGMIAVGCLAAGWGGSRARRARVLLTRPVVIRLDDDGAHLASGPIEDHRRVWLAWPDVEALALLPAPSVYGGKRGSVTLLRFVARSDDRVHGFYGDPYTRRKADLLGLTAAQACLTLIQGENSAFRVPLVVTWSSITSPAYAWSTTGESGRERRTLSAASPPRRCALRTGSLW